MKLRDLITRADPAEAEPHYRPDLFCDALGVQVLGYNLGYSLRMTYVYVQKWLNCDSWCGCRVYFLDGEPVAVSYQSARKSRENLDFVSIETASRVQDLLRSLLEFEPPLAELDEDVGEGYGVRCATELLVTEALYEGKQVRLLLNEMAKSPMITVRYADGTEESVPVRDLIIPYRVRPA